ncbi:SRPBCC family protein [Methylotuvimicrobium buryatense]|uniref:SRPBCC family protein n=1 Tax=Methylotuvimicrobium buryatense TaxID=95641 RepID=A0A4P9UP00_METBY|nr:SRPBCC family protein [Methylotuvimicrobium buryatense]QCW83078.1 SRPBCC family protein [Methylotuvimicrobium buryatense]
MKKFTLLVSALFLFAAGAHAHGPVRQKVKQDITINAPADKVWALIKNFDDMSWLPAVASTTGEGGNKKGATRVLTLKDGGSITEELKKHDDKKMSYAYKIKEMSVEKTISHSGQDEDVPVLPVSNYAASIDLKAKGDKTQVIWQAGYYRAYMNNNPPAEMNEEAANTAVNAIFKEGLENLKALAEK